jgi:hypothetical protein
VSRDGRRGDGRACATPVLRRGGGSEVLVDQVLKHLLTSAAEQRLAIGEDVGFEFFKADFAFLDLGTDAGVEGGVALLDEGVDTTVLDDAWATLRPRAKASMPPMWAWKRSTGSKDSRRHLASKLRPPVVKPPILRTSSMISVVR